MLDSGADAVPDAAAADDIGVLCDNALLSPLIV